jgi:hypothetical protein
MKPVAPDSVSDELTSSRGRTMFAAHFLLHCEASFRLEHTLPTLSVFHLYFLLCSIVLDSTDSKKSSSDGVV